MKTIEDIIRKICNYSDAEELSPSDDITVHEAMEAMEEYAQERTKDYYPKEFCQYILDEWRDLPYFETLDELFTHWKQLEKK